MIEIGLDMIVPWLKLIWFYGNFFKKGATENSVDSPVVDGPLVMSVHSVASTLNRITITITIKFRFNVSALLTCIQAQATTLFPTYEENQWIDLSYMYC